MEMTPSPNMTPSAIIDTQLTDIVGLRQCGIFPAGKEPSIRTLREWTKLRRIPSHKVGHFVYYDAAEVCVHICTKLKVPARG
jgi:hypothetical protein